MIISKLKINPRLNFVIFAATLSLALAYGLYRYKNGQAEAPAIPVEATSVRVGPLDHKLAAIGVLQSNQMVILRPEVSGIISKISFNEGQPVQKDQVLISLEDSIAKANLKEAQAEFNLRKLEFNRAETLLQRSAGSITDKDSALTKLEVSEASLIRAHSMLSKMNIMAPFEGHVGIRKVNVGDFVTPGQDLVNILDLNPMKLDFRVPEIYLEKIKLGQTLDIVSDALPDQTFTGTIYAIDPQIDPLGHSILLRAFIDNEQLLLRPGLFAKIHIILDHNDQAIFIPVEALIPQDQKQLVYRIENNKALLTEVKIGTRNETEVEILEGLKPNDSVVTAGQVKLNPGAKIKALPSSKKIAQPTNP